jgi:hypothetical protein
VTRFVRFPLAVAVVLVIVSAQAGAAAAQTPAPTPPERSDPDIPVDPLQPDFNLAALPTTLRMPAGKWGFRVTHRFTRPLGQGDFGDLAYDLFGFDGGAQIGLELRYGLLRGTQVVVHRTSNRAILIFGQHSVMSERHGRPIGLDVLVGIEGENNLRDQHKGTFGVLLSRSIARRLSVYAEPLWIGNTNAIDAEGTDNDTLQIGLGGRLRLRPSTYLLGEITPRLAGYDPGVNQIGFGIEHRAGGHLFQLNFSNGFGTTLGQLAQGGITNDDWFLGFNISRKFF